MEKVFLNKEGVQVYPPLYPDMTGPGTEYMPGSKEDLAYARGYEDAEADMIAKQSKGQQVNKNAKVQHVISDGDVIASFRVGYVGTAGRILYDCPRA